jgi:hypothetical protein
MRRARPLLGTLVEVEANSLFARFGATAFVTSGGAIEGRAA